MTILKAAYLFLEVIGLIFPDMKPHQSYSEFTHFLKQIKRMKSKHLNHCGIFFSIFNFLFTSYIYVCDAWVTAEDPRGSQNLQVELESQWL